SGVVAGRTPDTAMKRSKQSGNRSIWLFDCTQTVDQTFCPYEPRRSSDQGVHPFKSASDDGRRWLIVRDSGTKYNFFRRGGVPYALPSLRSRSSRISSDRHDRCLSSFLPSSFNLSRCALQE